MTLSPPGSLRYLDLAGGAFLFSRTGQRVAVAAGGRASLPFTSLWIQQRHCFRGRTAVRAETTYKLKQGLNFSAGTLKDDSVTTSTCTWVLKQFNPTKIQDSNGLWSEIKAEFF